jgi:glutathione S-transferase
MKLYDFALAPNPRRVRMFLAEKGVAIPTVQVNTRQKEQFAADFVRVNPYSVVPVLELDDGTCIGESVAICRYVEETHPTPPLMGTDPADKAIVEMWNRRAEFEGMLPAGEVVRNSLPLFADRAIAGIPGGFPQIPAVAEQGRKRLARFFELWNARLADHQFVAGARFSIADITAFVAVEFAKRVDIVIPPGCDHVARWHAAVAGRDSAKA